MKNPPLLARGALSVTVLMEGTMFGAPPTRQTLDDWIVPPPVAHTAVMEDGLQPDSFTAFYRSSRDDYFIFDLRTMKLVAEVPYDLMGALGVLDGLLDSDGGG